MALNVALARQRREALGLSLTAAAKLIGVNHAALHRWETGEREPRNSDTLRRWAAVLELEPADLYESAEEEAGGPSRSGQLGIKGRQQLPPESTQ